MHGQGKFEWHDGKSFEGKYENDKKHGPGIFSWPDGSKCVGIWQQGKQHGVGTHVNSAGLVRKGRPTLRSMEAVLTRTSSDAFLGAVV